MSIITNKLNSFLENNSFNQLHEMINEGISPKSETYTYKNQLVGAIKVLRCFDSNYPRPNHMCVRSDWPQMGKTGVLIGVLKLIVHLGLAKAMGIEDVYYITGDNSTGLLDQSKRRLEKCIDKLNPEFKLHVMKNSDMKSDLGNTTTLKGVLVFIDESHYGTSSESNILIKWLKSKGLDMHNNKNLIDKNVYIISNSATLFNEEISDVGGWKSYVTLEPGENYVGFSDFFREGCYVGVEKPMNKGNVEDYCISFAERIEEIEKRSGKRKCAIVRIHSVKSYKAFYPFLTSYFHIEEFFTAKRDIDYYKMWWTIEHDCDSWDKPLMIVIIGACRMGDTIPLEAKKNIAICYDCAGDKSVMATIQGLPGRVAGYWYGDAKDDWKDVSIFINSKHYSALVENHINKTIRTPLIEKIERKFIPSKTGSCIELIPDDSFVEIKTNRKFDGKTYNAEIEKFLNGPDGFKSIGKEIPKDAYWIPGRRNSRTIQSHFEIPEFMANVTAYADRWKEIKADLSNDGRTCYTTVYEADDNIIKVRFGTLVRGDYETEFVEKTKITKTLAT